MSAVEVQSLLRGNRRALAKAITLVESELSTHRDQADDLLRQVLPHTGRSLRVGISGTPGVGKSTFVQVFGELVIEQGHRLAVLAIDPSSPTTGGSILGDKTRMDRLSRNPGAFIRPSPSGGQLGGVAQKTREATLLCEAAGYDVILIETVGIGQSESDVAAMVDFFLVLLQPYAGDELQGIKKGVLELADALVINKADGNGKHFAEQTQRHYQNALDLLSRTDSEQTRVLTCSARTAQGIANVWQTAQAHAKAAKQSGSFETKRSQQRAAWMRELLQQLIQRQLDAHPAYKELRHSLELNVAEGKTTPLAAAQRVANLIRVG